MMDKIVATAADIEKLLAWRDEHNDLVRSMPVPLREVEIQIVESGISIKCFRSDKKLKLYLDSPTRKLGHVVFAPLGNGLWKKKVSTLPADCNPTETEQGALTVYGSLMALMTYGTGSIRGGVATTTSKAPAERKKLHKAAYGKHHIHHSLGRKTAYSGSQRPPCKPGLFLYCERSLPPLQERKDGLDCGVPQGDWPQPRQDL